MNQSMNELIVKAVIGNNVELVALLLQEGANPNQTLDSDNVTLLHFAAQNNSLEVIPLLIEAGADIHAKTRPDGQTALDIAILHNNQKIIQLLMGYVNNTDSSEN